MLRDRDVPVMDLPRTRRAIGHPAQTHFFEFEGFEDGGVDLYPEEDDG